MLALSVCNIKLVEYKLIFFIVVVIKEGELVPIQLQDHTQVLHRVSNIKVDSLLVDILGDRLLVDIVRDNLLVDIMGDNLMGDILGDNLLGGNQLGDIQVANQLVHTQELVNRMEVDI